MKSKAVETSPAVPIAKVPAIEVLLDEDEEKKASSTTASDDTNEEKIQTDDEASSPKKHSIQSEVVFIFMSYMLDSVVDRWGMGGPFQQRERKRLEKERQEEEEKRKKAAEDEARKKEEEERHHEYDKKKNTLSLSSVALRRESAAPKRKFSNEKSDKLSIFRKNTVGSYDLKNDSKKKDDKKKKEQKKKDEKFRKPIDEDEDVAAEEEEEETPGTLEESDEEDDLSTDWRCNLEDEEVEVRFKNGNHFAGTLSRCEMAGQGTLTWNDGVSYKGDFVDGFPNGNGEIKWPDGILYRGEVQKGWRHGKGILYDKDGNLVYTGGWKMGLKHGEGMSYYSPERNSGYGGTYVNDHREGKGVFIHPSGARYSGEWKEGFRHGPGVLLWTNGQMYDGQWEYGEPHGYGEAVWMSRRYLPLPYSPRNSYLGMWQYGEQHGYGTYIYASGAKYEGEWKDGSKHGKGYLTGPNGHVIEGMFENNKLVGDAEQTLLAILHAPSHTLNWSSMLKPYSDEGRAKYEERWLRRSILTHLSTLRQIYCRYANLMTRISSHFEYCPSISNVATAVVETPNSPHFSNEGSINTYTTIASHPMADIYADLPRLAFWQLLRDCKIHHRGIQLPDIDEAVANNPHSLLKTSYDPFEPLLFWQFLLCMVNVAVKLYCPREMDVLFPDGSDYLLDSNKSSTCPHPGPAPELASAFNKMMTENIIPNAGTISGTLLTERRNVLPLTPAYTLFRSIGTAPSAREVLRSICDPSVDSPFHTLSNLKCPDVLQIIAEICPVVRQDGVILKIEHKLTFLEWCEILLECAARSIKTPSQRPSIIKKGDSPGTHGFMVSAPGSSPAPKGRTSPQASLKRSVKPRRNSKSQNSGSVTKVVTGPRASRSFKRNQFTKN